MGKAMCFLFFVSLVLVINCAAGDDCDSTLVSKCYNDLVHYEGLGFPMYGGTEDELDDTCRTINISFDCIYNYASECSGKEECNEECAEMISYIEIFSQNTGLRDLHEELCNPYAAMRETYLENYVCLEDNQDKYAACHNDSQLSQEFMSTSLTEQSDVLRTKCCFFSWYHDCFTNITRDTCSINATVFISFSLHKLVGHLSEQLCDNDEPVICDRPPLPPDVALDEDKPDRTDEDVDNTLDGIDKNNSTALACSLIHVFIALCGIVVSKHLFSIK